MATGELSAGSPGKKENWQFLKTKNHQQIKNPPFFCAGFISCNIHSVKGVCSRWSAIFLKGINFNSIMS